MEEERGPALLSAAFTEAGPTLPAPGSAVSSLAGAQRVPE